MKKLKAASVTKPRLSKAEIVREIPKLSHDERQVLADCDRLALERFKMLDAMEAEDDKNASR